MYECPEPVILRAEPRDDLLDHFAVGELDIGAGRINHELLGQIAGELVFVLEQNLLVFLDALRRRVPSGVSPPVSTSGPR